MVESTQADSTKSDLSDFSSIHAVEHKDVDPSKMININVGVLGHVDSGKTSLCKALSTVASTAGFDKSP
jgi:polynucleotide 5'-kinase involved in rRNA processing